MQQVALQLNAAYHRLKHVRQGQSPLSPFVSLPLLTKPAGRLLPPLPASRLLAAARSSGKAQLRAVDVSPRLSVSFLVAAFLGSLR